jgi:hypothetical protein
MTAVPGRGGVRALVAAWLALLAPLAWAQAPAPGGSVSAAALRLIEATPAGERGALILPFKEASRSDWHYTPRRRDGLAWKQMSPDQRAATTALLRTALNERGHDKVRALMALEITLRELESFGLTRDPENYALALYGKPGEGGWGWRIEGHHLSLHFSLAADRYVATLPASCHRQYSLGCPSSPKAEFPASTRSPERLGVQVREVQDVDVVAACREAVDLRQLALDRGHDRRDVLRGLAVERDAHQAQRV